jgi:4-amino-4-deoxy-L-arabinose transferase-like glycosyltransferase
MTNLDGRNVFYAFAIIFVFLAAVKLPAIIATDIQPWDEGMYASRVLSIKLNGDFLDQSNHSIGRFYSGSHPPLLIWTGYFASLIFGFTGVTLKSLILVLSFACLILIYKTGERIYSRKAGIIAALMFSSNLIFNIFSKRFQFDIPYTFLILVSFYLFLIYLDEKKSYYNILAGVFFGLCLMVKILVGFYIPAIILLVVLVLNKKINYTIKDLITMSVTGLIIALPWHIYMFSEYGKEFFNYFFFYHIYERAFFGVEQNTKSSGFLYHINYLLDILPYGVIIFFGAVKKIIKFRQLTVKDSFLLIWFFVGLVIITLFKTKLEVYILLILVPGVIIGAEYLSSLNKAKFSEKIALIYLTLLNIAWSVIFYFRTEKLWKPELAGYSLSVIVLSVTAVLAVLMFISILFSRYSELSKLYYGFILLFFFFINIFYLINVPYWENSFKVTDVKKEIEKGGRNKLIYVSSNYRHNPQLTFYFDGIDLGWNKSKFDFLMLDTKNGANTVKNALDTIPEGRYDILVERNNINRGIYPEAKEFIPAKFRMVINSPGYELYRW